MQQASVCLSQVPSSIDFLVLYTVEEDSTYKGNTGSENSFCFVLCNTCTSNSTQPQELPIFRPETQHSSLQTFFVPSIQLIQDRNYNVFFPLAHSKWNKQVRGGVFVCYLFFFLVLAGILVIYILYTNFKSHLKIKFWIIFNANALIEVPKHEKKPTPQSHLLSSQYPKY